MVSRILPLLLGSSLLVAGCVVDSEAQQGAFYPKGFTDGCRTAEAEQASFDTSVYRDAVLFKTEPSYATGWRSGYAQCTRRGDFDNRPGDLGARDTY